MLEKMLGLRFKTLIALGTLFFIQFSLGWAEDSVFFPCQKGSESELGGTCPTKPTGSCSSKKCGQSSRCTSEELVSDPDQETSNSECSSSGCSSTSSAKSSDIVILYGPITWKCPTCEATKAFFKANGVKFEVQDYVKNAATVKKYGNNAVPTFYYKGKYYAYHTGFAQLKELLGVSDAPATGACGSKESCAKNSSCSSKKCSTPPCSSASSCTKTSYRTNKSSLSGAGCISDSTCPSTSCDSDSCSSTSPSLTPAEVEAIITQQLASNDLEEVRSGINKLVQAGLKGLQGGATGLAPLFEALESNSNAAVRKSVAYILGKIGGEAAVPRLIKAFGDSNSSVVREAEIALGRIGEPAVKPLASLIQEAGEKGQDSTLISATGAMLEVGINGVEAAVDALNELAVSPNKTVVAAAKYALEKIRKTKKDVPIQPVAANTAEIHVTDDQAVSTSPDISVHSSEVLNTSSNSVSPSPAFSETSSGGLTARERNIADKLISVFENSTTTLQYDYAENLGDGRGITLGRAGFCTGTGDVLLVVQKYLENPQGNKNLQAGLSKYLSSLKKLASTESAAETGLSGFTTAWKSAVADPAFRADQDAVVDEEYYNPALNYATALGAKYPLTRVALCEVAIMHGCGEDKDSLGALIERATKLSGGTPTTGVSETTWLKNFLNERKKDLQNPANKDTAAEWREAVGRADAMLAIFNSGNLNLDKPIIINPFGSTFSIS